MLFIAKIFFNFAYALLSWIQAYGVLFAGFYKQTISLNQRPFSHSFSIKKAP